MRGATATVFTTGGACNGQSLCRIDSDQTRPRWATAERTMILVTGVSVVEMSLSSPVSLTRMVQLLLCRREMPLCARVVRMSLDVAFQRFDTALEFLDVLLGLLHRLARVCSDELMSCGWASQSACEYASRRKIRTKVAT